ncbi:MAG TPA: DUF2231 domain-containing protein [Steroidobacteraceae bacterium]|nr:DUF2231 domain-containing protein [Steroidobacteraceae bacterium]
MGPYHAIMVHFPVAFWIVSCGIVIYRACSDATLARALDRVLPVLLVIGLLTGVVAYVMGQFVWSPAAVQKTPLGRNHMIGATWTLSSWAAVLYLRWRAGEFVWCSPVHRVVMATLGIVGGVQLAVTGTLGGHLHGAPAQLSDLLRVIGFDVYTTLYLPTWALIVVLGATVAMPVLAVLATRVRVTAWQPQAAAR